MTPLKFGGIGFKLMNFHLCSFLIRDVLVFRKCLMFSWKELMRSLWAEVIEFQEIIHYVDYVVYSGWWRGSLHLLSQSQHHFHWVYLIWMNSFISFLVGVLLIFFMYVKLFYVLGHTVSQWVLFSNGQVTDGCLFLKTRFQTQCFYLLSMLYIKPLFKNNKTTASLEKAVLMLQITQW
jgi:hypothetical protein